MKININEIRAMCRNEEHFSADLINTITESHWLNIWVPEKFGGLNLSLTDGLTVLKDLAQADGSLGWMVTLCSGANYFVRNLEPSAAGKQFSKSAFFGGSGMVGGTAEQTADGYILNGKWKYATGAPYLTHFTLNAWITEHGESITDSDRKQQFRSFIVAAQDVKIIEDWHTMGMKATATHSFEIENIFVPAEHTFAYNHFYGHEMLDRIPFLTFADITLAVNFIGMAHHLSEAFSEGDPAGIGFSSRITEAENQLFSTVKEIENELECRRSFGETKIAAIHTQCRETVQRLTDETLKAYMKLGITGCSAGSEFNRVFRDFFTATQHSHFRM